MEETRATASDFGKPSDAPRFLPLTRILIKLTGHYPDPVIIPDLAKIVGDEPDEARLTECYKAWRMRSWKSSNFGWVKWYHDGDGSSLGPLQAKQGGRMKVIVDGREYAGEILG